MVYKKTKGEIIFDCFNYLFLTLLVVVTLYPCYYVLVASVSNPIEIFASNGMLLYPKGFSLSSYAEVIKSDQIWIGYKNTIIYVVCGGFLSVMLTVTAAFGLTRKGLPGKNLIMFLIMFTMYFSGGLIPTYLVVKAVGLLNSPLAMIIVNAVTTYNLIITISYFRNMPDTLEEAAKIDGAGDYTVLFRIMLPLAKPIIAVISLYYMVAIWNNFMTALIYLSDRKYFPLQMILREILIQNNTDSVAASGTADDAQAYAENLKFAIIVVSTLPILCVYPFIQKYFVKGVMIGAIKG
ncbi:MAG: carbohydrate ABC transporter permease [Clostridia bacterium]|nr:carbohydrate ABC transporter permease [Clostridia bacterium]